MPLIAAYAQAYPNIHVDFRLYGWSRAMDMLLGRKADLAVMTEPAPIDGAHLIELERTPYLALMPRGHPLASRDSVSLADLARVPVVLPEEGSFTQCVVRQKTRARSVDLQRLIRTSTFADVKEVVLHGIGTGIILANSVHPSDQLATVPIAEMSETHSQVVAVPGDKRTLRLVQSFVDLVDRPPL